MAASLVVKPSMPGTMFWNMQQYMCIFAIVNQVQFKYWGNVRWCPKDDFSTTEVYICISLNRNPSFNTCPKGYYLIAFIK